MKETAKSGQQAASSVGLDGGRGWVAGQVDAMGWATPMRLVVRPSGQENPCSSSPARVVQERDTKKESIPNLNPPLPAGSRGNPQPFPGAHPLPTISDPALADQALPLSKHLPRSAKREGRLTLDLSGEAVAHGLEQGCGRRLEREGEDDELLLTGQVVAEDRQLEVLGDLGCGDASVGHGKRGETSRGGQGVEEKVDEFV